MNNLIHAKGYVFPHGGISLSRSILFKILFMKLTVLLSLFLCLQVCAGTHAQTIDLDVRGAVFKSVLMSIQKQSDYSFVVNEDLLQKANPVTASIHAKDIKEALAIVFFNQPFEYEIKGMVIVLKEKTVKDKKEESLQQSVIRGRVTDSLGTPMQGVIVQLKGTNRQTFTDRNGQYEMSNVPNDAILSFRLLSYEPYETPARGNEVNVMLKYQYSPIDETVVIGYGTTTKRLNTGSVGRITAKEIENQPVSNPLATLAGRVPGVVVTENSGVPGAGFSVQIRGRNSLVQGSEPLYLIDGIPFAPGNNPLNRIATSALGFEDFGGGLSPLYNLNPANIESIEILKDADATAIYGSRGANGVVMITTKKATIGKTTLNANIHSGFSRVARMMDLMNTEQYLEMRREAFRNDDIEPDVNSAPDLLIWDTDRYTDHQRELIGGTAHRTNAQLSISGGTANTNVLFSGGYLKETNVFPGYLPNQRGNGSINANHNSSDNRFQLNLSTSYAYSENRAATADLTSFAYIAPNFPSFYDEHGNLQWEGTGIDFQNPFSFLHNRYVANTENLNSNLSLSYQLLKPLTLRASMGYNFTNGKEKAVNPASSENPVNNPVSNTVFANNRYDSWIIEPQAEYIDNLWLGKLSVLLGATLQSNAQNGSTITASGFSNESLMESLEAASALTDPYSTNIQYRYGAAFGRINYNIDNKYLINITGRRDGSSRFGPGRQFANFGAVGVAWIFTEENWMKSTLPVLSYGKLRGSYGSTGNDQIGDYQFLDAWGSYARNYSNTSTLYPMWLYNPNYGWEVNRKMEMALELGFFQERILVSGNYYRNRSDNQLVQYTLPTQTGFTSITRNMPALIQNSGWEFMLNTVNVKTGLINWTTSFNITLPRNELLGFPDLETSPYFSQYVIGEPLNLLYNFRSLGVDRETGNYHFLDVDESGTLNITDWMVNGSLDPTYYGGLRNTLSIKGFEADVFFEFRRQQGLSYLGAAYQRRTIPGMMYNHPLFLQNRWQQPGDIADIKKYSTVISNNYTNFTNSDGAYEDASYIRLKNISIAYNLPQGIISKVKATNCRLYLQGQNLLTFTNYSGIDPETLNPFRLPPLRTFTFGAQIIF